MKCEVRRARGAGRGSAFRLRHRRFRRGTLAFTIIEVMLAIGLFSLIILAIYQVWTGILRASKAARTAADSAQRARVAMRALQDSLTTAQMFTANMPPQNLPYYAFLADMDGDVGRMSFVAHLPATFPGVGRFGDSIVRRVVFTIRPDKDGSMSLVMLQAPMMITRAGDREVDLWLERTDRDVEPYSLVLAKDVEMFGFEFWGQDPRTREWKWLDHWDSTNSLPALVHVGLGLGKTGKRGEPQDVVHRYVALPATAIQPDWQVPGMGQLQQQQFRTNQPPPRK